MAQTLLDFMKCSWDLLRETKPWSMQGVKGVYGFVSKAFRFFADPNNLYDGPEKDEEVLKTTHKTIKKITEDLEAFKFNTPISQLMILTNLCVKKKKVSKETAEVFSLLLSPYAPHAAEEIYALLGNSKSLAHSEWPLFKEELTKDDQITMAVQVNGKTRATIEVDAGIGKDEFLSLAKKDERIQKYLKDGKIVKEIYVPGRICNLVVK